MACVMPYSSFCWCSKIIILTFAHSTSCSSSHAQMTAQLETWASQTRHFWGFSERQDYDPNCSSNLAGNDGDNLRSYVDACRSNDRGTGSFGIGHGDSSGWFCAQRRPGRSLGWLQAMYGSLDESGSARSPLPDMLLIVDDDTSLVSEGGESCHTHLFHAVVSHYIMLMGVGTSAGH